MMLNQKVKTFTGKRIVQVHRFSGDAQAVFRDLYIEANTSTEATLGNQDMLSKITNVVYDGRTKTAVEFITTFEEMLDTYNEMQMDTNMRLHDSMMKTFLQNSVTNVTMLLDVSNQEKQAVARGAPVFNYAQYVNLLKSAAALYDRKKLARRSASKVEVQTHETVPQDILDYIANRTSRHVPGSTMDKTTWDSLKPESKKVWDMLDDEEKAKVLAPGRQTQANVLDANQHSMNGGTSDDDDDEEAPGSTSLATGEINAAASKARSEAHPADTRRMMGTTKKPTLKAKFTHFDFSDDDDGAYESCDGDHVDAYWGDSDDDDSGDSDSDFHRGD